MKEELQGGRGVGERERKTVYYGDKAWSWCRGIYNVMAKGLLAMGGRGLPRHTLL